MRILICEWTAYMQDDLEDTLHDIGIDTVEYGYRINNFEKDDYFLRSFRKILESETIDAVMTMNYMAPLAVLCSEFRLPYIAWVYDCPFGLHHPEETMGLPTNHIFFFDRCEANKFIDDGYANVHHLPLAVNTKRLDTLLTDETKTEKYKSDVSFVGLLYGNDSAPLLNHLPDYERGSIDTLMRIQSELYGAYVLGKEVRSSVTEEWRDFFADYDELYQADMGSLRAWIEHTLAKEITRRERLKILKVLSGRYHTALYTPYDEPRLPDADIRGVVAAYDEAPFVYRNSKINLNITLKDISSGISLRVMEILGAGGFLLSNWQPEIAENFIDGEEVVMYESIEDAIYKAMYYMSHDEERMAIAEAGRRAVERFSFENQVNKLLKTVFSNF